MNQKQFSTKNSKWKLRLIGIISEANLLRSKASYQSLQRIDHVYLVRQISTSESMQTIPKHSRITLLSETVKLTQMRSLKSTSKQRRLNRKLHRSRVAGILWPSLVGLTTPKTSPSPPSRKKTVNLTKEKSLRTKNVITRSRSSALRKNWMVWKRRYGINRETLSSSKMNQLAIFLVN